MVSKEVIICLRLAQVSQKSARSVSVMLPISSRKEKTVHKYYGVHPYLIVSNNIYNKNSGQCEVIPFTTKRWNSRNPVHVDFGVGEVDGLPHESTLVIEGRDTLLNSQLSEPIGTFSDKNWQRAANAMVIQCPMLAAAFSTNLVSAS